MAQQTLSGKILLRNDTATNWTTSDPVLGKGEIGIEINTNRFKIGDGVSSWSQLSYVGTTVTASATNGHITVDGTDVTVYTLPTLYLSNISDAGTAASANTGTASGNVPVLDSNGKLNTSVLPALAITETFTASSENAMLALTAQKGDLCVRTDQSKTYILADDPASTLANWTLIQTPAGAVTSVNTKTGAVTLDTDDISEGSTNLYYTSTRFSADFATKASTGLTDSSDLLRNTDTLVIDCGNA